MTKYKPLTQSLPVAKSMVDLIPKVIENNPGLKDMGT